MKTNKLIIRAAHSLFACGLMFAAPLRSMAQGSHIPDIKKELAAYDVSWHTPGPASAESMPVGNGAIGLNVWVTPEGELNFYIGKTDSWGNDVKSAKGLMKLGGVRVSLLPNPLVNGAVFLQTLKLHDGEILINEGKHVQLKVWVDANHPVIRIETKTDKPVAVKVSLNDWRLNGGGDTITTGPKNSLEWYHRNYPGDNPYVANLTYGGVIKGDGLKTQDDTTLVSGASVYHLVSVYPLTAQTATAGEWKSELAQQVGRIEKLDFEQTRRAHLQWWDKFWHRSWIYIRGDQAAADITRGYVLQRFVTACAGRGAYPIKFNGSVFVVDNPALRQEGGRKIISVDPDFRTWGGQYWFQNTRPMYWPRLMAGDFDEMMPLFKMYAQITRNNEALIEKYYHHDGSYFAETAPFYGGVGYWGPEVKEDWTGHYFTPILELSMMMIDYYYYTGDKDFAKKILVPVAADGLEFFDQHFKRDAAGKLLLDPDNSIEMFWKVHDPAPDIAGLHAVTARMLALPDDLTTAAEREKWQKLQSELPDLPKGQKDGQEVLLPYTGLQTARPRNLENPELYAIYPFRLYGLGRPDLQLARNTFEVRKFKDKGCWVQDPIQAAMLGLADVAESYVLYNFLRKDPRQKFPAFWAQGHDYTPDEDNGGNGENGLQEMLMQIDGRKIMLLPAWPKDWSADFKLHAPYNTTVQGTVKNGKITVLTVLPASRRKDVQIMGPQPGN